MNQSVINYKNEKYSIWKRIGIFLLDALMTFLTFLALFYAVGIISTKSICSSQIKVMNEEITNVMNIKGCDYFYENKFGLARLDYDKFMDKEIANGNTVEKGNDNFYVMQGDIDKLLNQSDKYVSNYKVFYGVYVSSVVVCVAIPLIIFELLIPLFTKKRQTLSMMIFKVGLVNAKEETSLSQLKVLLRFIFIFIVEFLTTYLLINWIGLFFICLITLVTISFTSNRSTLHDLVIKSKVKEINDIYSE